MFADKTWAEIKVGESITITVAKSAGKPVDREPDCREGGDDKWSPEREAFERDKRRDAA